MGRSGPTQTRVRKSRSGATLTEARRRELGQERIIIRMPPPATEQRPWSERIAALCERAGHSRADHLMGWVLAEEAELADLDRGKP